MLKKNRAKTKLDQEEVEEKERKIIDIFGNSEYKETKKSIKIKRNVTPKTKHKAQSTKINEKTVEEKVKNEKPTKNKLNEKKKNSVNKVNTKDKELINIKQIAEESNKKTCSAIKKKKKEVYSKKGLENHSYSETTIEKETKVNDLKSKKVKILKSNPISNALTLKKNTQIDFSENLKNESNFIKYLETLQLKSYRDKLFQKNNSVKYKINFRNF